MLAFGSVPATVPGFESPAALDTALLGKADRGIVHALGLGRMHGGLLRAVIVAAAVTLISLTWGFTLISMGIERSEARVYAEGNAANLARTLEWQLTRQLQTIDETMQILAVEWKNDPAHFDPKVWKSRSSLLSDPSLQLSILDAQGVVSASTRLDILGTNFADRDYFQAQRSMRRDGLFIGPATKWRSQDHWEINLSRRLNRDDGTFAGVIAVAYDPWAISSLFQQVDLGAHGFVALLGSDGSIRALVSPDRMPAGEDVSTSEMYRNAVKNKDGVWTGPSAPDGVQRVHAFRHLGDQDLTIVIGVDQAEALRTADSWASTARFFASGITVMVVVLAALLMREITAARRRETRMAHGRRIIEEAYAALELAKGNADEKRRHLEATLSGMSDGVMLLDDRLRLVEWNARFAQFCGVPPGALRRGMPFDEILRVQALSGEFGPIDVETEVRARMSALRNARSVGVVERLRPNGRTLELRRTALPGGGFVTLYSDITARKQVEEAQAVARRLAEEAVEQKSRFVAIVSHEIRTPLNAVVNSLGLLDRSVLSPSQHRLADTARQAGDALLELVNDILELSKSEAGHLAMRPTMFDIKPVLEGVQDMFAADALNRDISISLDVQANVPDVIRADSGRLRQVIMNFVSNAIKFSQPGEVMIQAAARMVNGCQSLYLSVSDQGPPIPEHEAAHLFQPFSRLENARTNGAPGTGLGLAICERLARLMKGNIGVQTAASGGNEFWIVVPLEEVSSPVSDLVSGMLPRLRIRRVNVLLVEDIPANHLVTATMLRRQGHRVDIAESGPEAIRMIQEQPYDLVFMDIIMPGMNGYETARHIRSLPGAERRVPIIALTANTAAEDRTRCLEAGMNDMVGKPLRQPEMMEVLSRTLQESAAASEARPASAPVVTLERVPPLLTRMDAPVLDLGRVADMRRGLPVETFASLIDQCIEDIARRLPRLVEAVAATDTDTIEEIAHTLAGMGGTYGLASIERRMRKMTAAAKRRDFITAGLEAAKMPTEIEKVQIAVREVLHEHAA